MSLAWSTYDTELPAKDATANPGDPGHRWLTAVGSIAGNQATMDIEMTSGGLFDIATAIERTDPPGWDGSIILTFDGCNSGTVEYDIPSINRQGIVPIQRVAVTTLRFVRHLTQTKTSTIVNSWWSGFGQYLLCATIRVEGTA